MFQSTRPCGARRFRPASSRPARQRFNPRARAGRDMMGRSRNSSVAVFQSTRPCGARHSGGETVQRLRGVSIHAPVRGATWAIGLDQQRFRVSIHAPVRGATRSLRRSRARTMFQSTRPCGARRERVVGVGRWLVVSIHAPVRGATLTFREPAVRACCFNPRARAGRDLRLTCAGELQHEFQSTRPCGARLVDPDVAVCAFQFQSTRPCGARRPRHWLTAARSCFNPRARAGRDERRQGLRRAGQVSIHAPVRGATVHRQRFNLETGGFNPRARAGRDSLRSRRWASPRSFNPRARAGRDSRASQQLATSEAFQSTRPCGARPSTPSCQESTRPVSIHAPVRGATSVRRADRQMRRVSIHAPVRGATPSRCCHHATRRCFNPRARAGRDQPARCRLALAIKCFNPRARAGRDRPLITY